VVTGDTGHHFGWGTIAASPIVERSWCSSTSGRDRGCHRRR
jgi:hypothetical protein